MNSKTTVQTETLDSLAVDDRTLGDFCRRWNVVELSLFGSAARGELLPESDIDLLVVFEPDCGHSVFDLVTMREELAEIFGREVDLVERDALTNPYRRKSILKNLRLLYAA